MFLRRMSGWPLIILALIIGATACSGSKARRKAGKQRRADAELASKHEFTPGVDVIEASIRGKTFVEHPTLATIYFDYDSSNLGSKTLNALKKNAEFLKNNPDYQVLVAGHCDERGTIEYNMALGQKRAKEVREYYIRLGVTGRSIATISYGEEKDVCAENTEECWGLNRRSETLARTQTASNRSGD